MSPVVSAARRIAGAPIVQDICSLLVMAIFLFVATYGAAGLSMLVTAWRAAP